MIPKIWTQSVRSWSKVGNSWLNRERRGAVTEAWGASFVKLDEKARVIVPAKARAGLAGGVYLTRGGKDCIYLFSREQFDAYRDKVREAMPKDMPAIAFDRLFYSSVVTQEMDKQGRITIPTALKDYASLDRDLAVFPLGDRIEIWAAAHWQEYVDQYEEQYSKSIEEVR
jgi:MraZ protein